MKVFCDISNTGNVALLIREQDGDASLMDIEELTQTWINILSEYSKIDNNYQVEKNLNTELELKSLIAEYMCLQALLFYAKYKVDDNVIDSLRKKGYPLNLENSEKYADSVERQIKRSGHLMTRANIIKSSIESDSVESDGKGMDFDDLIVYITSNLKINISDDITVKRFLAYKKQVEKNGRAKIE